MEARVNNVSGHEMNDAMKGILERWGLPTLFCIALMWMVRHDLILPLVEQHSQFLRTIGESQREIADAVKEQTKLLYALQPKGAAALKQEH
jgi:hypothetical protein